MIIQESEGEGGGNAEGSEEAPEVADQSEETAGLLIPAKTIYVPQGERERKEKEVYFVPSTAAGELARAAAHTSLVCSTVLLE